MRGVLLPLAWSVVTLVGISSGIWLEHRFDLVDTLRGQLPLFWRRPQVRPAVPESDLGKLAIYAFLGQSNAVGVARHSVARMPLEQHQVYVFGNDYRWRTAIDPLDDSHGQVDLVSVDRLFGYSAATAFAYHLRQLEPEVPIGLLSCARGGSSIGMWAPSRSDATLFGACYKRILAASAAGQLAGVIFMQGERDAVSAERTGMKSIHPGEWATRFTVMVDELRAAFGRQELPVVFGKLGAAPLDGQRFKNWAIVRAQQERLHHPCTQGVPTEGVQKMEDGLHYTATGYDQLGQLLADAMRQLRAIGCD